MRFQKIDTVMRSGIENKLFTGASLEVAQGGETLFSQSYGVVGESGSEAVTASTLFDLASLTKILAVTPCWMKLAESDFGIIDRDLSTWFPQCPDDKKSITPRHLLAHASGLPAWRPYYLYRVEKPTRQRFTLERILAEPLRFRPGEDCLYSDLGFMLLGFIIEAETGHPLDRSARADIYEPLGVAGELLFKPAAQAHAIAHTRKDDPPGLVNDLNARALGGAAGHAGLFGTAAAVTRPGEEMLTSLKSPKGFFDRAVMQAFAKRFPFPTCPRALGFDAPSPEGSSSGGYFASDSIGHTGFTGTSLWIDLQSDLIVTLLTNRVYMGESDLRIKLFRPLLHNVVRGG